MIKSIWAILTKISLISEISVPGLNSEEKETGFRNPMFNFKTRWSTVMYDVTFCWFHSVYKYIHIVLILTSTDWFMSVFCSPAELQFYTSMSSMLVQIPVSILLVDASGWEPMAHLLLRPQRHLLSLSVHLCLRTYGLHLARHAQVRHTTNYGNSASVNCASSTYMILRTRHSTICNST